MLRSAVVAVVVVLDVALWAIAGRLDVAVHALLAAQQATGTWPSAGLPHEWIWWVIVLGAIAISIGLAILAARNRPRVPQRLPVPRRFVVLAVSTVLAFALWAGWDIVCVAGDGWHSKQTLHDNLLPPILGVLVVWLLVETGAMLGVSVRRAWNLAPVVRVHFFLLGLLIFGAFLFPMTSGQAIDLMRAWTDAGWRLPTAALASALVLGEMMRESGIRLSGASPHTPSDQEWRVFRVVTIMPAGILFAGAVIAATDSLLLDSITNGGVQHAVLAAAFGGAVMVTLVATVMAPNSVANPKTLPTGSGTVAAVTGFGVGMVFAVASMWTGIVLIAVTLAFLRYQWSRKQFDQPTPCALPLNIAGGIAIGVGFAVYWNPIYYPRQLGMIAVAFAFAAGLLGVLHVLALGAEALYRRGRPPFRIPVVLSLLVWFGLATQCAPQSQHQTRVVQVDGVATPTTLDVATELWLSVEYRAIQSTGRTPQYLPLLLVADSGGGSKSAYWTDLVLDCLIGGGPMESSSGSKRECTPNSSSGGGPVVQRERGLFITSSVSGGSVGISRYVSNVRDVATGAHWVDRATGGDFLSPTVAWGLFHDLPDTFFGWLGIDPSDPTKCETGHDWSCRYNLDRAAIEEAAIAARSWDRVPSARTSVDSLWTRSLSTTNPKRITPLTIFNTAVSGGKGRVLVSPVDMSPLTVLDDQCPAVPQQPHEPVVDAIDAADLYTKHADGTTATDLDVTTAGLLSGRFPVVDPVARVGDSTSVVRTNSAPPSAACLDPSVNTLPAEFVRDGGYVENTGLLTIVQALPTISMAARTWTASARGNPPVVIWVLSIDDDAAFINGNVNPSVQRPGAISLGTKASDETLTELSTESLTVHQGGVSCFGRLSPVPGVGARAATGWLLSKTVRNFDLAASLADPSRVTLLQDVQDFLDGAPSDESACPSPMQ